MDDTRMDLYQFDEGTGRSVPSTPISHTPPTISVTDLRDGDGQDTSIILVTSTEDSVQAVEITPEGQSTEAESEQTQYVHSHHPYFISLHPEFVPPQKGYCCRRRCLAVHFWI